MTGPSSAPPSAPAPPARDLGFWSAVALVMGNMIGSGVFLLPASLALYGRLSVAGWLLSTAGAILLALAFARLARRDPAAGGLYAYTRRAFGDLPAFIVAWGYWISCWATNAALAVAFIGYLDPFVPRLVRVPSRAGALAIGTVWLLTAVNIRGVRPASRVQAITTLLKVLPLVVIGTAGLFVLEPSHFPLPQGGTSALSRQLFACVTLTLWAFLGLECATIPADSVRQPERTIPRATIFGTLLAAAIYVVATVGVMGVVAPATLASTTAPFADAARRMFGDAAADLVALGAAVSCFGALNGWILIAGQLPQAVAADGLFPLAFARRSARGTPETGLVIAGVLTTALIVANFTKGLVDLFTFIILLATLSSLVAYVFCSLADTLAQRRAARPWAAAASGLAFAYSVAAVLGAGVEVILYGILLILAGLPVYGLLQRRRREVAR